MHQSSLYVEKHVDKKFDEVIGYESFEKCWEAC
jgi:hypothetical protein